MQITTAESAQANSVFFTSLGCSKNLVDSEVMLGHLGLSGFSLTQDPEQARTIIVNTCSFIEASKVESIEKILELADFKDSGRCEALVVSGCMAQRYSDQLEEEMPEVDLFIGTGEYHRIVPLLKAREEGKLEQKSFVEIPKYIHTEFDPRVNTSPFYTAWLKVSEGCNRNCTFCIIPTIRGSLRSRSIDSLVAEANRLAESGVKEINIISQDLSSFGVDLKTEEQKEDLYHLLLSLEKVEGIRWIRLFYYYPEDLDQRVIELIKTSKKICPYLDMPVQHFSSSVLKRMNRKVTGDEIHRKIAMLKKELPHLVLRTSIIVGFPGETQEDFEQLLEGVERSRFDHLGVFKYSDEEGTPAFKLQPKVPQEVIEERFEQLYELQKSIARENNQQYIGKELDVVIEGYHDDTDLLLKGRHVGQAPDIDGQVIINDGFAEVGEIVKVQISEVLDYDLLGAIVQK